MALSARAQSPTPDLEAQYQSVLVEMKHPTAAGLLVTEIGPESPAGAAGLHAGDIIYHYANQNLHDLQSLRQQVAQVVAANTVDPSDQKVLLGIHRGEQTLILQLPRQPLGIRAIEVEAGVPITPNPLPSPRGSFSMKWDELLQNQATPDNATAYFHTSTVDPATSAQTPIHWQRSTLNAGDGALFGEITLFRFDPSSPSPTPFENAQFRLRTGDFLHDHPFLLDTLSITLTNDDSTVTTIAAHRSGLNLIRQYPNQKELTTPCPIDALPNAAIPLVAAALPQQENGALALHILSIRDFLARPGYLLITRGKKPLPPSTTDTAWRIDLMHCGVIVESYYLNDQRRLLQIDTPGATPQTTHRAANELEAAQPAIPKTQPAPTTLPNPPH